MMEDFENRLETIMKTTRRNAHDLDLKYGLHSSDTNFKDYQQQCATNLNAANTDEGWATYSSIPERVRGSDVGMLIKSHPNLTFTAPIPQDTPISTFSSPPPPPPPHISHNAKSLVSREEMAPRNAQAMEIALEGKLQKFEHFIDELRHDIEHLTRENARLAKENRTLQKSADRQDRSINAMTIDLKRIADQIVKIKSNCGAEYIAKLHQDASVASLHKCHAFVKAAFANYQERACTHIDKKLASQCNALTTTCKEFCKSKIKDNFNMMADMFDDKIQSMIDKTVQQKKQNIVSVVEPNSDLSAAIATANQKIQDDIYCNISRQMSEIETSLRLQAKQTMDDFREQVAMGIATSIDDKFTKLETYLNIEERLSAKGEELLECWKSVVLPSVIKPIVQSELVVSAHDISDQRRALAAEKQKILQFVMDEARSMMKSSCKKGFQMHMSTALATFEERTNNIVREKMVSHMAVLDDKESNERKLMEQFCRRHIEQALEELCQESLPSKLDYVVNSSELQNKLAKSVKSLLKEDMMSIHQALAVEVRKNVIAVERQCVNAIKTIKNLEHRVNKTEATMKADLDRQKINIADEMNEFKNYTEGTIVTSTKEQMDAAAEIQNCIDLHYASCLEQLKKQHEEQCSTNQQGSRPKKKVRNECWSHTTGNEILKQQYTPDLTLETDQRPHSNMNSKIKVCGRGQAQASNHIERISECTSDVQGHFDFLTSSSNPSLLSNTTSNHVDEKVAFVTGELGSNYRQLDDNPVSSQPNGQVNNHCSNYSCGELHESWPNNLASLKASCNDNTEVHRNSGKGSGRQGQSILENDCRWKSSKTAIAGDKSTFPDITFSLVELFVSEIDVSEPLESAKCDEIEVLETAFHSSHVACP